MNVNKVYLWKKSRKLLQQDKTTYHNFESAAFNLQRGTCSYGLSGPTDNPFTHIRSTHAKTHMPGDTANHAKGDVLHHVGFHKESFL